MEGGGGAATYAVWTDLVEKQVDYIQKKKSQRDSSNIEVLTWSGQYKWNISDKKNKHNHFKTF